MKIESKDKWRVLYGVILIFISLVLLLSRFTEHQLYQIFIWIMGWSFLSLGIYAFLFGLFWSPKEELLAKSSRKYFRYIAFQVVMSALISVWLARMDLPIDSQYLAGFGFGLFFGVWIHTIYQGIDKIRDNLKLPR